MMYDTQSSAAKLHNMISSLEQEVVPSGNIKIIIGNLPHDHSSLPTREGIKIYTVCHFADASYLRVWLHKTLSDETADELYTTVPVTTTTTLVVSKSNDISQQLWWWWGP